MSRTYVPAALRRAVLAMATEMTDVDKEISPAEAATLLDMPPFVAQLLNASVIPATGAGDGRRVKLRDLLAYKEGQSADNRRDLATALAVAQEAGAYD